MNDQNDHTACSRDFIWIDLLSLRGSRHSSLLVKLTNLIQPGGRVGKQQKA